MSPFPIEAIDEIIWRIDEALGTSDSPKTAMRGWIKKANADDVRVFLAGIKFRLENAKHVLADKGHQDMLRRDGYETESVVLRDSKTINKSGEREKCKTLA